MILTNRRRHFYLVGQSKHKVGACGVNSQASAVWAGNELPFVAFSPDGHGYELVSSVRALVPQKFSVEEELMHVKHVEVKSPHVGVMWKFGRGVISSETGNVRRRPGAGRSCATTSTDDRYIQLTARRNRTENATQLQRQLLLATGRRVSSQTVRNRLHEGWLYARRRMVCIPLTPRYRAARRRWAAEHRDWEQNDWSQVLFTDDSRFSVECDTRHVLVWRTGALEITPHSFVKGHNTEEQDDNAQPHRARLVENMLEAETIQRMEWPACSPDLNPIEPVWDMLGRHIAAGPRPPATVRYLEIALLEEWNSIPQSLIDNLIVSMANRCAAVLAVRGDHTPY
ncbi:transposable element Tcb2 transposase [Trichonephila clavipes]|uniref:Transposable element Tcb2 transposase n=1 Tax=Trichonephila clavipes TaxID=2585209 RepID=A0A8X6VJW2_TRICX|nr:transposable element Tcb2 transposase [Trichonephila clavipes]